MSAPDALSHETASELLPWLVNDSLADEERAAVLEHASCCVICRRELHDLGKLRNAFAVNADEAMLPEPDMRRINSNIDFLVERQNRFRSIPARLREFLAGPWRVAFAAQSAVLLAIAVTLLWPVSEQADFATLTQSQNATAGNHIRAVFSPELDDAGLLALLDEFGLMVVDGRSKRGVYTLGGEGALSIEDRSDILDVLQSDRRLLFAQPAVFGPGQ